MIKDFKLYIDDYTKNDHVMYAREWKIDWNWFEEMEREWKDEQSTNLENILDLGGEPVVTPAVPTADLLGLWGEPAVDLMDLWGEPVVTPAVTPAVPTAVTPAVTPAVPTADLLGLWS